MNAMFIATQFIFNEDLEYYPCFILNGRVLNLNREGIEESFQNMLQYFTDQEEYEKCKILTDLNKKWNII